VDRFAGYLFAIISSLSPMSTAQDVFQPKRTLGLERSDPFNTFTQLWAPPVWINADGSSNGREDTELDCTLLKLSARLNASQQARPTLECLP
jgi:hypothetical protein